ncbi:hypothetical protein M3936_19425 [Sutcliffiella horikoshii]|uniref:hypothetical protein n=1 Tax=Sutcliffiella horikoshii TaxID=79883 RepID=UPI001CBF73F2|nr:hypothetical protein [Sutcliffiella horikoshii]MCM3619745.1 hypothetical protein [Sutcliffiella horikoshii]UAL49882.1 hypothetical protein K7887_22455 [Sutcliffiella horikoshii]
MIMKADRKFHLRKRTILLEEEDTVVELLTLLKRGFWETDSDSKETVETILTASRERLISELSSVEKKRLTLSTIDEIELNTIQYNYIINTYDEDTFKELLDTELQSTLFNLN